MKTEIFDQIDELISKRRFSEAQESLQLARRLASTPTDQQLIQSFERLLSDQPTSIAVDSEEFKPGISLVSCSMNRHENLILSLKSWLQLEVDEVILVDWSSQEPLDSALIEAKVSDPRIKIIRIEGEPKWILTYAFNVGLRAVSYSTTYKLDADITTSKDFVELNPVGPFELVRGLWKKAIQANKRDQMYVNGSFGCQSKHLKEVGYYNELIRSYGWDDSDLYYRLTEYCGLQTQFLDVDSIVHLEQEDDSRIAFQDISTNYFIDKVRPTIFNNSVNRITTSLWDTWTPNKLQEYATTKACNSISVGHRLTEDQFIPNWVKEQARTAAASQFIEKLEPKIALRYSSSRLLAEWLLSEFDYGASFKLSTAIIGNYFHFGMEVFQRDPSELNNFLGYSRARFVLAEGESRDTIETKGKTLVILSSNNLERVNQLRDLAGYSQIDTKGIFITNAIKQTIELTE
ncbi:hypothetical protein [uncultured Umboniibacter sp.]|uniref:glycosyltransferase family 2 protein n=1 Tax=uncultured Umboniibacter sp. TaxID=1798917 RepID=UPI0026041F24|nr:hypothetical protein [uncultured Umboniibacter sp.]